jgi:hypothetical protein
LTLFEYLAIAFSLLLSFTALRLVGGLAHTLSGTSRYWVHATQNAAALLMVTLVFWAFWSYREVQWTYPKFLLALSGPCALYFLATTLIPDDPSTVKSWREYYFSVRIRLFVALGLGAVLTAMLSTVVLEMPITHPARIGQITLLAIAVVGIASKHHRVHATLALALLAAIVAFGLSVFLSPDAIREASLPAGQGECSTSDLCPEPT